MNRYKESLSLAWFYIENVLTSSGLFPGFNYSKTLKFSLLTMQSVDADKFPTVIVRGNNSNYTCNGLKQTNKNSL